MGSFPTNTPWLNLYFIHITCDFTVELSDFVGLGIQGMTLQIPHQDPDTKHSTEDQSPHDESANGSRCTND